MNKIAKDILEYFGIAEGKSVKHYGVSVSDGSPGRGSGRYPKGSGENPNQHGTSLDFADRVKQLRKEGKSESEIAEETGCKSTTELRAKYSQAINERRAADVKRAKALIADGKSKSEAAREMGINESTLRSLLDERSEVRTNQAKKTADFLKQQIDEKGMIDVGAGVEVELGISKEKMNEALSILEKEGYIVYGGGVPQVTNPGKQTNIKVICPPGTEHKEIYNFENVHTITDYKVRIDDDGTEHIDKGFEYPSSLSSDRLLVRLANDPIDNNGHVSADVDGTIQIRRGCKDLDLGDSRYAQVRIMVDGESYLKGMAYYSDDMPDGIDVIYNTSKTDMAKAMKPIKNDPDNPFGSLIKETGGQYHYTDENGERKLGLINKAREEGDWEEWSDSLPSQFLAKQNMQLINKQLNLSIAEKQQEFDEICALTNPTVKKNLLEAFANDCDSAAVHLQAAALPRQKYQVILPVQNLPDNQVYAPNFKDGETVALIRYPHGGPYEMPILTVNNKNPDAIRMMGKNPSDAIGINKRNAEIMSGADFDGDTVMVVPCNYGNGPKIKGMHPLKELEGFDTRMAYGYSKKTVDADGKEHYFVGDREFKTMTKANTQKEMGVASNLIMDMTLKGANEHELARAVKYSMVVIDAEKHKLDYHQCYVDNGIAELKRKYQGHYEEDGSYHEGAGTLLTRAKSEVRVEKRIGTPKINPETGELEYKTSHKTYVDEKGNTQVRTQISTKMAETKDARTLSTGTPQEEAYANYANHMKAMANQARKEILVSGKIEYKKSARETYKDEVESIMAQLELCKLNKPRERQAQLKANAVVQAKKRANPDMTKKEIKKAGQQALAKARSEYGAGRRQINITERGWEAIQAGAFSETILKEVLEFADSTTIRTYATPRATTQLTPAKQNRIKAMKNSGYTNTEIADALGVSVTTVNKYGK